MRLNNLVWALPKSSPTLADAEVHLWRAALDQPEQVIEALSAHLADDERQRADRFVFERDRRKFIVGRGALREILAGYTGQAPAEIGFTYSSTNKPSLVNRSAVGELEFNLSHSHECVLYALTRRRMIGVDVEWLRPIPNADGIVARYFSVTEIESFQRLSPAQRDEGFFNGWTRKEAYVKALGQGIGHPLDQFSVSLIPGEPARLYAVQNDPGEVERWSIQAFQPFPGYVAALIVEGQDWTCHSWEWRANLAARF
jgi:4'-phosphopantetheinyl transferase